MSAGDVVGAVVLTAAVLIGVVIISHGYLAARLVVPTTAKGTMARRIGLTLIVVSAVVCASVVLAYSYEAPGKVTTALLSGAAVWAVIVAAMVALTVLSEILRMWLATRAARETREENDMSPGRRMFLQRVVAAAVVVTAGAIGGVGMSSRNSGAARGSGRPRPTSGAVVVRLPFTGSWIVRNSPAESVPSHGSDLFGTRYAIDFVKVDDLRRTAPTSTWRTFFATEEPSLFYAFGVPVLAAVTGTVVATLDGETDHEARRSQLSLIPYALTQRDRIERGVPAIAGNYVTIRDERSRAYVTVVHLKRGSVSVAVGDRVREGDVIAACGNTGNSTQPHVHLQVTDSPDFATATAVPVVFAAFDEQRSPRAPFTRIDEGIPPGQAVVRPHGEGR